ncbi:MAG: hypothetical protein OEV66_05970 [Spirochaetia bacterium]|nr:hypothetical protein [Spirochaetia bacterium]
MNKSFLPADNYKAILRKMELYALDFFRLISERIQNPRRIALYAASAVLGFVTSRFVNSMIMYMLASELQGMASPLSTPLITGQPRKDLSSMNIDLGSIIDGVFFKRAVVETKTSAGEPNKNFSLIGTLEGDPKFASAIIKVNGEPGDPQEYSIGQKIGSAILIAIGYEKIWVKEGGIKYKIEVGESSQDVQSKSNTSSVGDQKVVISRQDINDKILGNPAAIYGGGASFGPNLENGKITGFRLHRIPEGHIFYTLGARSGDIIKSVNGFPMSDTGQMMELWNNIKTMPRVNVELVRDGKPMKIDFEIRN